MTGKKAYRICLVGAGRMGAKWAKIIAQNKRTNLVLLIDPDPAAAAKLAQAYHVVTARTLRAGFLAAHAIDAVIIAVPHKYLFANAKIALQSRVHTLVEKPGARTLREMQFLVRLAARQKTQFMLGCNYRFFDAMQKVKKLVIKGQIGKINFMRIRHGHPGRPHYNKEWRMDKNLAGGGVLMDQGAHVIDLVNWFLPHARLVAGALGATFWRAKVEDNAAVTMQTAAGQMAIIHVSVTQWKPLFSLEIYGSKGYCLVNGLGSKYGGDGTFTFGKLNSKQRVSERKVRCATDPDHSFRNELAAFIHSLSSGWPVSPNGQDAINVLRAIKKIYG
ncbi:MAG: Gfo/Idh/MocA family oxidoreductase [Patescibacteria group bacterium]